MKIGEFVDRIDSKGFIQQFKNPYATEWYHRTGIVDITFPNGPIVPVATDALHVLNILRDYKKPVNANKIIGVMLEGDHTGFQRTYIQQYLELFAYYGLIDTTLGGERGLSSEYGVFYKINDDALSKCNVETLRSAPEKGNRTRFAANIKNAMELVIGGETRSHSTKELLECYPKV